MSFRDELNDIKATLDKRRGNVIFAAKITVVALAVAILTTAVFLIVDLAGGGIHSTVEAGSSGGGKDRKAPVITLKQGAIIFTDEGTIYAQGNTIYTFVGLNIPLKNAISVTDDSGNYTLSVDNAKLDNKKEGEYEVIYTATDGAGNKTTLKVTVVVTKKEYSYATLMSTIAKMAENLGITESMSKEQKIRAVYKYVNSRDTVEFTNESNIPDINRDNWKTDWVEEAIRTLQKGSGDCYSYYSVSKAFFEYFGIENVGIMRDENGDSGTHFWFVVNIGNENTPKWYYYDATRLAGYFGNDKNDRNSCLITLAKLQSYVRTDGSDYDFYDFNPADYPTVETKELN